MPDSPPDCAANPAAVALVLARTGAFTMRPAEVELWPILGAQGITEPRRPLGVTGDCQDLT